MEAIDSEEPSLSDVTLKEAVWLSVSIDDLSSLLDWQETRVNKDKDKTRRHFFFMFFPLFGRAMIASK